MQISLIFDICIKQIQQSRRKHTLVSKVCVIAQSFKGLQWVGGWGKERLIIDLEWDFRLTYWEKEGEILVTQRWCSLKKKKRLNIIIYLFQVFPTRCWLLYHCCLSKFWNISPLHVIEFKALCSFKINRPWIYDVFLVKLIDMYYFKKIKFKWINWVIFLQNNLFFVWLIRLTWSVQVAYFNS